MSTILLDRINAALEEYKKVVMQMSDRELYNHCFGDGDYEDNDFCMQELLRRGIERNRACHACQGVGCPTCNGSGELPYFE